MKWKMDMRFATWDARCLYRIGSLQTVANELANYNLDLVAVEEVGWVEDGSQPLDNYTFFCENGNTNHRLETGFCIHKAIISTVKRLELSDRILYITLRSQCDIIVLNVHAPNENESEDM
jgi:hypothetical protein